MEGMRTEFEFVLPRGYVDLGGRLHKRGVMRLATARDELEPLRDPTISGPDDPRLTLLVLARVITALGDLPIVTIAEMEGLFAADLAYLQDFYGVINFGSEDDIDALLDAQTANARPAVSAASTAAAADNGAPAVDPVAARPPIAERPGGRRAAIEEVPSGDR
jgi:hypothetical protein